MGARIPETRWERDKRNTKWTLSRPSTGRLERGRPLAELLDLRLGKLTIAVGIDLRKNLLDGSARVARRLEKRLEFLPVDKAIAVGISALPRQARYERGELLRTARLGLGLGLGFGLTLP